jgi:CRISPR-associated protein (TIGR02584 family)
MRSCTLVADLGPNPAPLAEALWALVRQRQLRVRAGWLVTMPRGRHYLEREFLGEGAALDQVRDAVGLDLLSKLHVVEAAPDGSPLDDEVSAAETASWSEARFAAAREAVLEAGHEPVVFAFIAGRRRSMTAGLAVVAQLLARPQDLCLDVRVTDRRVEGGSGFFFPEQPSMVRLPSGVEVDPATVGVRLVDLPLPRLRGLLSSANLTSFAAAMAAGQRALDRASPPSMMVDISEQKLEINGTPVHLPPGPFVVLVALVAARLRGEGWLRTHELEPVATAVRQVSARRAGWPADGTVYRRLLDGEDVDGADLAKARSDLRRALTRYCEQHERDRRTVVPELHAAWEGEGADRAKVSRQRLPVDPDRLHLWGVAQ